MHAWEHLKNKPGERELCSFLGRPRPLPLGVMLLAPALPLPLGLPLPIAPPYFSALIMPNFIYVPLSMCWECIHDCVVLPPLTQTWSYSECQTKSLRLSTTTPGLGIHASSNQYAMRSLGNDLMMPCWYSGRPMGSLWKATPQRWGSEKLTSSKTKPLLACFVSWNLYFPTDSSVTPA